MMRIQPDSGAAAATAGPDKSSLPSSVPVAEDTSKTEEDFQDGVEMMDTSPSSVPAYGQMQTVKVTTKQLARKGIFLANTLMDELLIELKVKLLQCNIKPEIHNEFHSTLVIEFVTEDEAFREEAHGLETLSDCTFILLVNFPFEVSFDTMDKSWPDGGGLYLSGIQFKDERAAKEFIENHSVPTEHFSGPQGDDIYDGLPLLIDDNSPYSNGGNDFKGHFPSIGPVMGPSMALVPCPQSLVKKTGLLNSGNTCYQNSILQAFVRMDPWRAFVDATFNDPNVGNCLLFRRLGLFTQCINRDQMSTTTADPVKLAMKSHTKMFENNHQHDAPEYFFSLIFALNKELKKLFPSPPYPLPALQNGDLNGDDKDADEAEDFKQDKDCDEKPKSVINGKVNGQCPTEDKMGDLQQRSDTAWKKFYATQPTILTTLLAGQTAQKLVCEECSDESLTFEPFEVLMLNLPQAKVEYHIYFFSRDPETCFCTGLKKFSFRFAPDMPVESLLSTLSNLSGCPAENIRLVQQTDPSGETFPFGLKTNGLLSDAVRDPNSAILAFQVEKGEEFEEYSIVQKTLLRHMSARFQNLVPITDRELKDGQQVVGLPFIISIKKQLMTYSYLTRVLMSYALKSTRAQVFLDDEKNHFVNLQDHLEKFGDGISLIYYKSQEEKRQAPMTKFYAPFLLNDHGTNQEIAPPKITDENGRSIYLSEDVAVETHGSYFIELQWIDDERNEHFPRSGIVKAMGNLHLTSLPVDHYYEHHTNIDDCLKIFSKEEDLGHDAGWKCTKCNHVRVAKKSAHIVRTPNMLVVQLVRFKHTVTDNGYVATKVHDRIEFPVNGFDISPWVMLKQEANEVFDLYAVVNHYGNCGGGHYTVMVRNWKDEKEWHHYDDGSVSAISAEKLQSDLVTSNAYLLFFKRRDFPDALFDFPRPPLTPSSDPPTVEVEPAETTLTEPGPEAESAPVPMSPVSQI